MVEGPFCFPPNAAAAIPPTAAAPPITAAHMPARDFGGGGCPNRFCTVASKMQNGAPRTDRAAQKTPVIPVARSVSYTGSS